MRAEQKMDDLNGCGTVEGVFQLAFAGVKSLRSTALFQQTGRMCCPELRLIYLLDGCTVGVGLQYVWLVRMSSIQRARRAGKEWLDRLRPDQTSR